MATTDALDEYMWAGYLKFLAGMGVVELGTPGHEVEALKAEFMAGLHAEPCHCGKPVAAIAEPNQYANSNMVEIFCGRCITVRCDAYPGACVSGSTGDLPSNLPRGGDQL